MPDIKNFALNLINQNPQIAQNPNAQSMLNVIQSGDSKKGAEIAQNLCSSYGITPEQALNQAKQFFHIPF